MTRWRQWRGVESTQGRRVGTIPIKVHALEDAEHALVERWCRARPDLRIGRGRFATDVSQLLNLLALSHPYEVLEGLEGGSYQVLTTNVPEVRAELHPLDY